MFPRAHFTSVHSFLATGELCPSPWTIHTITAALAHLGIPASSGSRRLLLVIFSDTKPPSSWIWLACHWTDRLGFALRRYPWVRLRHYRHYHIFCLSGFTIQRYTRRLFSPLAKTTMTTTLRTFDDTGSASISICSISGIRVIMTKTRRERQREKRKTKEEFKGLTTRRYFGTVFSHFPLRTSLFFDGRTDTRDGSPPVLFILFSHVFSNTTDETAFSNSAYLASVASQHFFLGSFSGMVMDGLGRDAAAAISAFAWTATATDGREISNSATTWRGMDGWMDGRTKRRNIMDRHGQAWHGFTE